MLRMLANAPVERPLSGVTLSSPSAPGPQDSLAGPTVAPTKSDADLRKMALARPAGNGGGHHPAPAPDPSGGGDSPNPVPPAPTPPPPDQPPASFARIKATVTDSDGNEVSTIDGTAMDQAGQTQYSDTFSTGDSGADTQVGNHVTEQYNVDGKPDSVTTYTVTKTDDGMTHLVGQRNGPDGTPYQAINIDMTPTANGSHVEVTENPLDGKSSPTHTTAEVVNSTNDAGCQTMSVEATQTVDDSTVHISAQAQNSDKNGVNMLPVLVGLLT